ncbi:MAG: hypothetical protein ACI87W_000167 [Halieaceae bacterium]|jgi:uncharacterized protein (DUF1499 family)
MANPRSAWIRWPGYIAWLFLSMLPIGILIVRSGSWQPGLMLYALGCLLSLMLLAFMAVQLVMPRWRDERSALLRAALPAVPGTVLLLMTLQIRDVPPIHDISTDTSDPPIFEAALAQRGSDSNPLEIVPEVIEQQLSAYPDVRTIRSNRAYENSYTLALETARELGWEVIRDDGNAGFIEAVNTSTIMQFRDDIVIRVRSNEDGSVVDLRSVSRVGVSDMGANAKRIQVFQAAFESAGAG